MTAIEPPALRPLSLSQLLDRAIRLYRQNFLVFIGIIALALVPQSIIQYVVSILNYNNIQRAIQDMQDPGISTDPLRMLLAEGNAFGGWGGVLVAILAFVLVQGLATGALAKAIEDSYLGRPISILGAYRRLGGLWATLLVSLFIGVIITIVLYLWMIVPCVGWLTGPGMLLFFASAVYRLIPATVVIEHKNAIAAIGRAWELTRRRFWWVLGFVAALAVLSWIVLSGPAALVNALAQTVTSSLLPTASEQSIYAVENAAQQAVTFLFQLIYLPLHLTALILMYFDLRVRTEGFDLALMAAAADEGQETGVATPEAPRQGDGASLLTPNEAGYFAAISVGLLAICGIAYGILIVIVMAAMGASQGF